MACNDLEEFIGAAAAYPALFDGQDPAAFVAERCETAEDAAVTASATCGEVAE